MRVFLIILTYLGVCMNFDAPELVSNTSDFVLLIEHTVVLFVTYRIVKNQLPTKYLRDRYYNFFLLSYFLTLLMVAIWWGDALVKNFSIGWDAFDPIKYYAIATSTLNGEDVWSLIYFPVALVYAAVMYVLGTNPLVPIFFNEILFLYAVLLLSKYINQESPQYLRYYSFLLLIPEILYFNMMSAKDVICMYCATIIFVKSSELFKGLYRKGSVIILILSFIVMCMARLSLSFATILGVFLVNLNFRQVNFKKIILLLLVGGMFGGALYFGGTFTTDGKVESTVGKVGSFVSGDVSEAAELEGQSEGSFARKLVPHNTIEFVVFGVIRSICYIIIDPRFIKSPIQVFLGDENYPLAGMVSVTTLLMFISCFYIFRWIVKYRGEFGTVRQSLLICIMYILIVGMFNPLMIHIRYRVVYDLLFFAIGLRAFLLLRNHNRYIQ